MTRDEIRRILLEELANIAPEADAASVPPDADLREALDIDSMDFVNLVIALHRRLDIDIPEADYGKVATLSQMTRYLASQKADRR